MDPEEIARRELDRLEKKKRKQERRLLKSQNKLMSGDLFHTPGSDSDSGVSHVTDSDHNTGPPYDSAAESQTPQAGRDHTPHPPPPHPLHTQNQNQRHLDRDAGGSELDSSDASPRSTLMCSGHSRPSTLQKLNPFSVESLLSDSRPRRTPAALPSSRPLIGKGHFLLYPITQPLGFIVPQTALKTATTTTTTTNSDASEPPNARCGVRAGASDSADASQNNKGRAGSEDAETTASSPHASPPGVAFSGGKSTQSSAVCHDFDRSPSRLMNKPVDAERNEHLDTKDHPERHESGLSNNPTETKTDCKEDVDME